MKLFLATIFLCMGFIVMFAGSGIAKNLKKKECVVNAEYPLVAISKCALSRAVGYMIKGNKEELGKMIQAGEAVFLKNGTPVIIEDISSETATFHLEDSNQALYTADFVLQCR
ncbi:MAG: hypothetical protein RDU30_12910 [Desulfovibrionaceae bacterium]|nr:hypothetical protein [Desulfovibrionaceae bacterium]